MHQYFSPQPPKIKIHVFNCHLSNLVIIVRYEYYNRLSNWNLFEGDVNETLDGETEMLAKYVLKPRR